MVNVLEIHVGDRTHFVSRTCLVGAGYSKPNDLFNEVDTTVRSDSAYVSREHVVIRRRGGRIFVHNLSETNGTTYTQGWGKPKRVSGRGREVRENGTISAGDLDIVIGETRTWTPHYAIIVGGNSRRLQGVRNDVDLMERELGRLGYATLRLDGPNLKRTMLLDKIKDVAQFSTPDSRYWFHFSGHGSGRTLELDSNDRITAEQLYDALDSIQGKTAVTLDSCRSGSFAEFAAGRDKGKYLTIAASGEYQAAYEPRTVMVPVGTMGNLTNLLVKFLRRCDAPQNLRDAFADRNYLVHRLQDQGAMIEGSGYTLPIKV